MTNRFQGIHAFTLVEMMISVACAMLIAAAVLTSVIALTQTFNATEGYSRDAETQLRLIDYVSRDLSESPPNGSAGVWVATSGGNLPISTGLYTGISATGGTLTILVPGYYVSGTTSNTATNSLIYPGNTVTYGTSVTGSTSIQLTGTISYYKAWQGLYGSNCYIRQENGVNKVIADHADGVLLEIMLSGTIPTNQYQVRTRFNPTFHSTGIPSEPVVNGTDGLSASEQVYLRHLF